MSISAWSVNSGTVALASAMRRAMTCWVRVSSCTRTSPLAVPTPGAVGRRRGGGRRRGSGGRAAAAGAPRRGRGLDVGLHDPPARAAAAQGGEVHAVLAGDPAGDGRGLQPLGSGSGAGGRAAQTRSARPAPRGWARPASSRSRRRARPRGPAKGTSGSSTSTSARLRGRGAAAGSPPFGPLAVADAGDHLADRQAWRPRRR